jgi:hypothetical protein
MDDGSAMFLVVFGGNPRRVKRGEGTKNRTSLPSGINTVIICVDDTNLSTPWGLSFNLFLESFV